MHRNISAPSHVTRAQAARILGMSTSQVHHLARKGGPLQAEIHWGTPMVPMWRILEHPRCPKNPEAPDA